MAGKKGIEEEPPAPPPLADYFWIAGIDSHSYTEQIGREPLARRSRSINEEGPIAESSAEMEEEGDGGSRNASGTNTPRQTLSVPSGEQRKSTGGFSVASQGSGKGSIGTVLSGEQSNRNSNSTITQGMLGDGLFGLGTSTTPNGSGGLLDFDFDKALRKFAAERETFLDELSFSAGAIQENKPLVPPQAKKLNDEPNVSNSGSLRRRISLRDLSSLRRAPSTLHRTSSIKSNRSTKRVSNYNSVIPQPRPLNSAPDMHPLKRKFEPVLLDRFPTKEVMPTEISRRGNFPDYVPMFAFPNDVNIVSADERPRSTWHSFTMTGGDGSNTHGVCVIIWLPLNQSAAEDLERRCEMWRRDNMTPEERELAASLGERLAIERAKLSRLLAKLPSVSSLAREALDEEIIDVEEKISLMTDLLRPVRHGAASKIEGLTDGDTGFWIPRAFGILGKDPTLMAFWKEWLKAVVVPMTNGQILGVAPSSPKVGIWKPLERYVMNLCVDADAPRDELTQYMLSVRDLRLYIRKDAPNELPGARSTDLYGLFRALSVANIVTLFEFILMESRIILLSTHTAMLHIASRAITSLLYPFEWHGAYIPVLPARLLEMLEAPFPYIVGVERRYDKINMPMDDFVLVDLDNDAVITGMDQSPLPRQQRRKLTSLLQLAAPHHARFGVPVGPPQYAIETFPHNRFMSENSGLFYKSVVPSSLEKLVNLPSSQFGIGGRTHDTRVPVFNAFGFDTAQANKDSFERPSTSTNATVRGGSPPSPKSPTSQYPSSMRSNMTRTDSGFALTSTLRGKRSGNFDSRRQSSGVGFAPSFRSTIVNRITKLALNGTSTGPPSSSGAPPGSSNGLGSNSLQGGALRRPSLPFASNHSPSNSTSSLYSDNRSINYQGPGGSSYAPSTYSPSTVAASTIMPSFFQPAVIRNTDTQKWVEGHCLTWKTRHAHPTCHICEEPADDGIYACTSCDLVSHSRCSTQIHLPCAVSFFPEQVRAAFVRCFASLLYPYRKHLTPLPTKDRKSGTLYKFSFDAFLKSLPLDVGDYVSKLEQTQAFHQFIFHRETHRSNDPSVLLFDQVILAKRNRGKSSLFSKSSTSFLGDDMRAKRRVASVDITTTNDTRMGGAGGVPSHRIPSRLEVAFLRAPGEQAVDVIREEGGGGGSGGSGGKFGVMPTLKVNGVLNGS